MGLTPTGLIVSTFKTECLCPAKIVTPLGRVAIIIVRCLRLCAVFAASELVKHCSSKDPEARAWTWLFSFVQLDDADYFIIGDFEDAIISAPYQLLKVMAVQRQ